MSVCVNFLSFFLDALSSPSPAIFFQSLAVFLHYRNILTRSCYTCRIICIIIFHLDLLLSPHSISLVFRGNKNAPNCNFNNNQGIKSKFGKCGFRKKELGYSLWGNASSEAPARKYVIIDELVVLHYYMGCHQNVPPTPGVSLLFPIAQSYCNHPLQPILTLSCISLFIQRKTLL